MRSQINGYVNLAFKLAGDLVDDITLISNSATGFDFATGVPTMGTPATTVIRGLIELAKKESLGSYELRVVCKAADLVDPSVYDRAIVRGVTYSVITPNRAENAESSSDGFLHTLYLAREKV